MAWRARHRWGWRQQLSRASLELEKKLAIDPSAVFRAERERAIREMGADDEFKTLSHDWYLKSASHQYSYNFSWMGRPIIQYPQDMFAMQEIIWSVRPDLIIEIGIAHGGSLIYYASLMEMMSLPGKVLGVDIDIRSHNRKAIVEHPMATRIEMIEGSSVDDGTVARVRAVASHHRRILVSLDSNHTHDHVLAELQAYAPLVTNGSYLVVFDTVIEDMPAGWFTDRPWDKGNNPKTALLAYLKGTDRFVIDTDIDSKLLISVAPSGYLRCVKD
jgi:cephalosporin hydroxylase